MSKDPRICNPVLTVQEQERLVFELSARSAALYAVIRRMPLDNDRQGLTGRQKWRDLSLMCRTAGNAAQIRVAVDDFKAILAEIRRLK